MTQQTSRSEPLGGGVCALVTDAHTFGTDALLIADFAVPKRGDRACDLGTGCGILPLLWCRADFPTRITAVDIQPEACALLRQSLALSGLAQRVTVVEADLRELDGRLAAGGYSLVTMNPPYQPLDTGIPSRREAALLARHEAACTIADAAACAARLLSWGGRFCLCQRPERLCDVLAALRAAGLEPKRLRFVTHRAGKAPWLFLVEAKRGGKPGLRMEPEFIMQRADGADSDELRRIYTR